MAKIIGSPSKYIQGGREIENIGKYLDLLGKKYVFIIDGFFYEELSKKLTKILDSKKIVAIEKFNGECSDKEINRLRKIVKDGGADVVVGVGGGKTIDTAKTTAFYEKTRVMVVPTAASTDAPCSSLSVIYTNSGEFDRYIFFPQNPDIVLVDTQIVANAPVRLLVSGMGDALATYWEARATARSQGETMFHAKPTISALALAKLCYETLLEEGYKAKKACEKKCVTKSLEDIIEANIYLSGIGFESGGLAAAHAIHNGLTVMPGTHKMFHGEKVTFGLISQLVLEKATEEDLGEVLEFCISIGLPVCFKDIGVDSFTRKEVMEVAKLSCAKDETIHNMPFKFTIEEVADAMITADAIGSDMKYGEDTCSCSTACKCK